jgi:hypothetical protein
MVEATLVSETQPLRGKIRIRIETEKWKMTNDWLLAPTCDFSKTFLRLQADATFDCYESRIRVKPIENWLHVHQNQIRLPFFLCLL